MPKHGIKLLADEEGTGPALTKGVKAVALIDIHLSKGDVVVENQEFTFTVGDRSLQIAGFMYGIEGMKVGGTRKFQASHHLCYRDNVAGIPPNAALTFTIKRLAILA